MSEKLLKVTTYYRLVLTSIHDLLKESFNNREQARKICPELIDDFELWLSNYWNKERDKTNLNEVLFNIDDEKDYSRAIIYYISGMTDNYAIDMYNKIIRF